MEKCDFLVFVKATLQNGTKGVYTAASMKDES